ncbi:MAG: dihydroorotase [Pseudomonadota bacterium]
MTDTYDLILKNGVVVNHDGEGARDIGVRDGKIAAIGSLSTAHAGEEIDCTGLHILPGVIDSQVHFREPGATHKEDLETGGNSAVMGGVTAVFEMPNTSPLTTTEAAIQDKFDRAAGKVDHGGMQCDHAFYVGATHGNPKDLAELELLPGVAGVKIFMGSSTGDLLVENDDGVREVLAHGTRRVAIHSEDEYLLREGKAFIREGDWTSHPDSRTVESAVRCTTRLLKLARETGRRIHILHISTVDEVALLAANKDICTAEILPQHLTFAAPDCYREMKGFAQMNPPVREKHHREGLWAAVNQGLFDVMGTDHAPHTKEEKEKPYPASPSGMPGVQTLVPVMLTYVAQGRITLARFVDLVCHGPQRVFGIAGKGRIALGYDADFTVVDLARKETITAAQCKYRAGWTPFEGFEATGWPVGTIIRGRRVMWDGQITGPAAGKPVRFQESFKR